VENRVSYKGPERKPKIQGKRVSNTQKGIEHLKTPSDYTADVVKLHKNIENMNVLYFRASTECKKNPQTAVWESYTGKIV